MILQQKISSYQKFFVILHLENKRNGENNGESYPTEDV